MQIISSNQELNHKPMFFDVSHLQWSSVGIILRVFIVNFLTNIFAELVVVVEDLVAAEVVGGNGVKKILNS